MKRALVFITFLVLGVCVMAQRRNVVDTSAATYDTVQYSAPKINPIRYFGSPFCSHFADIKLLVGVEDFGVGLDYAYLPELWGFGLSGYLGYANLWLSGGVQYRLSKPWSRYDWHFYGHAGVSCIDGSFRHVRPALEAGVRMAAPTGMGQFCYSSGSLGVLTDFSGIYLTVGLSVTLSTFFSFLLLFP